MLRKEGSRVYAVQGELGTTEAHKLLCRGQLDRREGEQGLEHHLGQLGQYARFLLVRLDKHETGSKKKGKQDGRGKWGHEEHLHLYISHSRLV